MEFAMQVSVFLGLLLAFCGLGYAMGLKEKEKRKKQLKEELITIIEDYETFLCGLEIICEDKECPSADKVKYIDNLIKRR